MFCVDIDALDEQNQAKRWLTTVTTRKHAFHLQASQLQNYGVQLHRSLLLVGFPTWYPPPPLYSPVPLCFGSLHPSNTVPTLRRVRAAQCSALSPAAPQGAACDSDLGTLWCLLINVTFFGCFINCGC